jgi:hypothetical protein
MELEEAPFPESAHPGLPKSKHSVNINHQKKLTLSD